MLLFGGCANTNETIETDNGEQSLAINSQVAFDGLQISGATVLDGAPPEPNEEIALQILSTELLVAEKEGFTIPFRSDVAVTGVYMQITSEDGGLVDKYYDIVLNGNKTTDTPLLEGLQIPKGFINGMKDEILNFEDSVTVDLDDSFPTGEFCVIFGVYDSEGNVSGTTDVCLTVASWGGDDNLVGEWTVLSYTYYYDGTSDSLVFGETFCEPEFNCQRYDEVIELKEDGSFKRTLNYNYELFDNFGYNNQTLLGNWVYDGDLRQLLLVVFEFSQEASNNGEIVVETTSTLPEGQGSVDFYDDVSFTNSELRIRENISIGSRTSNEPNANGSWYKTLQK